MIIIDNNWIKSIFSWNSCKNANAVIQTSISFQNYSLNPVEQTNAVLSMSKLLSNYPNAISVSIFNGSSPSITWYISN